MHAEVITGQVAPEREDDAMELFQNRILPMVRRLDGFHELYLLNDRANHRLTALTTWASADALRAEQDNKAIEDAVARWEGMFSRGTAREVYQDGFRVRLGDAPNRAHLVTTRLAPGALDVLLQTLRRKMVSAYEQMPGIQGYLALARRDSGDLTAIAFFDSRAALESADVLEHDLWQPYVPLLASDPRWDSAEVRLHAAE